MFNFILTEAEKIQKTMSEFVWEHYTGRYLFRIIIGPLFIISLLYLPVNHHLSIPDWGLLPISISMIALLESN